MRNGLPAIRPVVDDETESRSREAFGFGDLPGSDEQMAEEFRVGGKRFRHARDHPLGNHEDMNGRLRRNIAEREATVVLEDNVRGNFPGEDFFEKRHES